MKTTIIKNIGCGLLLLGTTACADYLEKESFDIITPEQVWQDPKLINGVMVNLYDGLNLEDFNYWYRDAWRLQNASSMSDEAQGSFQKDPLFEMPHTRTKTRYSSRNSPIATKTSGTATTLSASCRMQQPCQILKRNYCWPNPASYVPCIISH